MFNKEIDYVTGFSSEKYEINRISNIAFLAVLMISTIVLNAVAIITIQKTAKLKDKLCYFTIFIQSVVDLGVGCIVIPIINIFLLEPFVNFDACISILLARLTTILFAGLSIVTLSALTMERYLGVLHPMFHRTRLTKKGIVIYVLGGTLLLLSLVVISIFTQVETIRYAARLMLGIFLIFVVFAYTRIYLVIRRITRVITHDEALAEEGNRRRSLRGGRHAIACFIVVAVFYIFIIPFMLHPIFERFGRMTSTANMWWSVSFLLSISSINSVIFFWRNALLRNEAKKVAKSMFSP
jgi:hypothetical protein